MNASVNLVIWCKQQDHYLIEEIQQAIGKLNIKKILYFQDIITFEQNDPIIYLSTAMDRSIQSYDKQLYFKMAKKSMQNKFFMMQIKNKNASYYQSLFKEVAKINLSMNFYLNLSINAQRKLCFKTKQEKEECKKYFKLFKEQILKQQSQQKSIEKIKSQQPQTFDQAKTSKDLKYQSQKKLLEKIITELYSKIQELINKISDLEKEQNILKQKLIQATNQKQVMKQINEIQIQTQQIFLSIQTNPQWCVNSINKQSILQEKKSQQKIIQTPLQKYYPSIYQLDKGQNLESKYLQKIYQVLDKITNSKCEIISQIKTTIQMCQPKQFQLRQPTKKYNYLPYLKDQINIQQLSALKNSLMNYQIHIESMVHEILQFILISKKQGPRTFLQNNTYNQIILQQRKSNGTCYKFKDFRHQEYLLK